MHPFGQAPAEAPPRAHRPSLDAASDLLGNLRAISEQLAVIRSRFIGDIDRGPVPDEGTDEPPQYDLATLIRLSNFEVGVVATHANAIARDLCLSEVTVRP